MPKQNDGAEKLVEELAAILYYSKLKATTKRRLIQGAINIILRAVVDRELELPREAGRGRLHAHGIYEDVDWDDGRHGKVRNEDHRFIALCPTGTGEEG